MSKLAVSVFTTLLLLGTYVTAADHKGGPPREEVQAAPIAPPPLANEVIGRTYITTASTNYVTLVAGFNTEDSGISFSCPSGTCTLVVDSFATSGTNTTAGNNRALCLVVDGNIVGACAFNGADATDASYSAINSINTFTVGAGAHSAYMYFYSTDGTTMYTYTNVYRLYRP